jgi:hypothetical protein
MHSRIEILKNQKEFNYEIKKWLLKDFSNTKNELKNIETEDDDIVKMKKNLESKANKLDINKQINNFFINENNIYPKFYAWWNEDEEIVEILNYEA